MFTGIGMSLWIVWGLEWDVHVYKSYQQVTFQGCDLEESRHLYDQLSVMCPIMVCHMTCI